ncbi:hypothetical protein [Arthrobacter sp. NIO-1057]|uniref:hypothetical protein n=1 Tax=Arthrobacter sp. NIO-1057 TaxID=993071 RepID=UPI000818385D|nr:hypothetical protein [Arthrobacter sp. NIO-1057]SCC19560.1 hypothetical protein GA0061084_1650 [Arthrobacter sp. NIO-1057]
MTDPSQPSGNKEQSTASTTKKVSNWWIAFGLSVGSLAGLATYMNGWLEATIKMTRRHTALGVRRD